MRLDYDTVSGSKGHASDDYFELKTNIHNRLLDLLDLSLIDSLDQNLVKSQISDQGCGPKNNGRAR